MALPEIEPDQEGGSDDDQDQAQCGGVHSVLNPRCLLARKYISAGGTRMMDKSVSLGTDSVAD
jgi:hypothetical protein